MNSNQKDTSVAIGWTAVGFSLELSDGVENFSIEPPLFHVVNSVVGTKRLSCSGIALPASLHMPI